MKSGNRVLARRFEKDAPHASLAGPTAFCRRHSADPLEKIEKKTKSVPYPWVRWEVWPVGPNRGGGNSRQGGRRDHPTNAFHHSHPLLGLPSFFFQQPEYGPHKGIPPTKSRVVENRAPPVSLPFRMNPTGSPRVNPAVHRAARATHGLAVITLSIEL
jgi:hypothetical protein